MGCHYVCRVEMRHAALDVQTLDSIRIVARPAFVEIREETVVESSASAGAKLNYKFRIFFPDSPAYVHQSSMVFYI